MTIDKKEIYKILDWRVWDPHDTVYDEFEFDGATHYKRLLMDAFGDNEDEVFEFLQTADDLTLHFLSEVADALEEKFPTQRIKTLLEKIVDKADDTSTTELNAYEGILQTEGRAAADEWAKEGDDKTAKHFRALAVANGADPSTLPFHYVETIVLTGPISQLLPQERERPVVAPEDVAES